MPNVQIKWPKGGSPTINVGGRGLIVASGRADASIVGVSGQWWPEADPGAVSPAATVAFYHCGRKKHDRSCFHRWMIVFRVPTPDLYVVRVVGFTADGHQVEDRKEFSARFTYSVTVTAYADDDPIADPDDFVPYGDLTEYPLGTVTMTDLNNTIVYPSYVFSDCTDLLFWSAQFPTLASGTYVLFVEDSVGSASAQVRGLTVD